MSLSSQIKVPAQVKGAVGGGSGGGATSLDGLSDVVITTPADGHFVRYNGTNFVNQALSADEIPAGIGADKIGDGSVSTAEYQRINSLTSNAQDQLDAKVAKSTVDAKGDLLVGTANDTVGRLAVGSNGQLPFADSAESTGLKWRALAAGDIPKLDLLEYQRITTDQTGLASTNVDNTVVFNSAVKNEGSRWTESSGVFTCAVAGRYRAHLQVYQNVLSAENSIKLKKGSTVKAQGYLSPSAQAILSCGFIGDFSIGDTLTPTVAASASPQVGASLSFIQIQHLGA